MHKKLLIYKQGFHVFSIIENVKNTTEKGDLFLMYNISDTTYFKNLRRDITFPFSSFSGYIDDYFIEIKPSKLAKLIYEI